METDEGLVKKTLTDGNHHYGILIQRYADYLFGLGMRLTSGNRELAEDISQQSFLKSYTYLKSFDTQKEFKHWLTGIAINCYKDLIQKENQRLPIDVIDEPVYKSNLEGNIDFFNLIKPLAEDEKIIFTLKYVYEYQINEIANLLNLKPGTVKSKISRTLDKLK
ncbi:MAG TPA: RNA polymerase sigma factor [Porticoccaceae bacterium]|jgi:RNA polymerase sigma-70 factor (ECF subfamily)|nr:RNA polymerase sigma factor [Gammaproteobacteria bacterium]HIL61287.1 RNA polymerase sigma factor [Porticoccaceae bacterium]